MLLISRSFRRLPAVVCTLLALAGCSGGLSEIGFDTKMAVGSVSLIDRCSDFMHRAYPQEAITISGTHLTTDLPNATVTVNAIRSGVPANSAQAREIAAGWRCETGIPTCLRRTAGPGRSATTGQVS